jgi:uncharacterized protein (TIGR02145 family)
MKHVRLITLAVLASMLPCFAAVDLEGKVLRLDSLPKQGVVVSLSGTTLSDTTNAAGKWSLIEAVSSIVRGAAPAVPVSSHLVLRNGRIQMSLAGRNVFGGVISCAPTNASATPVAAAGRTSATGGFDTLVYSWNGKTILRDTIAHDSLVRKEIFRRFDTTVNPSITHGYVTDAQNHIYRTVQIGTQTWMAENLNYAVDSSWCYQNSADSCNKYGRLYTWAAVMNFHDSCNSVSCEIQVQSKHQGICPNGWLVPKENYDWFNLEIYVGKVTFGTQSHYNPGWSWWPDTYGFHTLLAGYRDRYSGFNEVGRTAFCWSSSEGDAHLASYESLLNDSPMFGTSKWLGYSVRCFKDAP